MAKKYFQKALSVGLSLALCAGMVAPGFAATFGELQGAIDSGNSVYKDGYSENNKAEKDEDTYKIKVEDGKDDEGNETRVVTLYEDVENAREAQYSERDELDNLKDLSGYEYWREYDKWRTQKREEVRNSQESGIIIQEGMNVTLDLNGHDIDMNPGWELTDRDREGAPTMPGTYKDENEREVGCGNYGEPGGNVILNAGDAVTVETDAVLTLKDSQGKWVYDSDSDATEEDVPQYQGGKITGATDADAGYRVGCSGVHNKGTLIMNGGMISGNGGGTDVRKPGGVKNEGDFILNDGAVSNNWGGVDTSGTFVMNGGQISDTRSGGRYPIYVDNKSSFTMNGGIISGNYSSYGCITSWGGSVEINGGIFSENEIDPNPQNSDDPYNSKGSNTTDLPAGSKIIKDGAETTHLAGTTIDKNGNVTTKGETVTKTTNKDGTVTITDAKGDDHEITDTNNGKVTVDKDGTTTVPEGGKITDKDGSETTYPDGTTIDKDGNVTGGSSVTKDKGTGDVTIDDGQGGKTEVTAPEDTEIVVNPDGSVDVPAGGKVTDKDGNEYELPEGGKITEDGKVVDKDGNPVEPKKDDNGSGGSQGGGNGVTGGNGEADVIVIDGVEVPLSGLVSVEDVLSVLCRLTESVDGERDEVVAWAVENGIIDEEADVEEIVTVAALRAILANYARAFELDVDVSALTTLAGEDDDIVMNCDEVIDEFFTKAEEDEAA